MNLIANLKSFIVNSRHILYVSYKPSPDRFKRTAKIIILGIALIGMIGFIIAIIISLLVYGNLTFI
jgi:protein translocase SEC61 complex gamma subunit